MREQEVKSYEARNSLAEQGGIVILGGSEDREIPLCELKQAFMLEQNLYNRSIRDLSVYDACRAYDICAGPLMPDLLFLHIGQADVTRFTEDPESFDRAYRALIAHIRAHNKRCRLVIVAIKNEEGSEAVKSMNDHLRCLAESERCEFSDAACGQMWNPQHMKEIAYLYAAGFIRPHDGKRPMRDLARILFSKTA